MKALSPLSFGVTTEETVVMVYLLLITIDTSYDFRFPLT
jgi:hypothetical protein